MQELDVYFACTDFTKKKLLDLKKFKMVYIAPMKALVSELVD